MKCPYCRQLEMEDEGIYTKEDWIKDNSIMLPMAGGVACSIPLPSKLYKCETCGTIKFIKIKGSKSINQELHEKGLI